MGSTFQRLMRIGAMGGGAAVPSLPYSVDFSAKPDGSLPTPFLSQGSFAISGGHLVLSSGYITELLTDPGFEAWNDANHLTSYTAGLNSGDSLNQDTDKHGGTYDARFDEAANGTKAEAIKQTLAIAVGYWVKYSVFAKRGVAAHSFHFTNHNVQTSYRVNSLTNSYLQYWDTLFNHSAGTLAGISIDTSPNSSGFYDDFSVKKLLLKNTIAYLKLKTAQPWLRLYASVPAGANLGLVMNLDDPTNPQNYILGVYSGFYPILYKCVNGTISRLVYTSQAALPNDQIIEMGWRDANTVELHTSGNLIATAQTINDASILAGQYSGVVVADTGTAGVTKFRAFNQFATGAIWAIGDSITNGSGDEVYALGWPMALVDLLGAWTCTPIKFAVGGVNIAYTKTNIDTKIAAAVGTPTHVIISHGANDINSMPDQTTTQNNIGYILDAINTKWPSASIWWNTEYRQGCEANTDILYGWVANAINAGRTAFAHQGVNANSVFSGHSELFAGGETVHPNYAGHVAYAAAMKAAMGL
jgi:lysophospholipase L1-like esterase